MLNLPTRPVHIVRRPPLNPGTLAPAFALHSSPFETISLGDLHGRAVVLAFYRNDWSPSCSDQLAGLQDFLPNIEALGAVVLGISLDGVWCHEALRRFLKLDFPLLSDSRPRGAVARSYGVLDDREDISHRALVVIDAQGSIVWSEIYPPDINPGVHGILTALESLRRTPPLG